MIRFENVVLGYKEPLLKVEIQSLEKGEAYALIGANGSGKSTFLKSISGQLPTVSGNIFIAEENTLNLSMLEKSRIVAFVPSRFPEIPMMKVAEFIGLGRTPYLNALGRLRPEDIIAIEEAATTLTIQHLIHKYVHQLSDGEKQLCGIARALCQDTSIILLDEPTSFLDYRNKMVVLDKINLLATQSGKCIVYSSHDLDLVTENCQKVIYTNTVQHQVSLIETSFDKNRLIELAF